MTVTSCHRLLCSGALAFAVPIGSAQTVTDYVVTNTADSGLGSLRQALLDSQTDQDASYVGFAIPGDGPHTITPLSPLPVLTDGTIVDGSNERGPNGELWIEISGAAGTSFSGLDVTGSGVLIQDVTLNGWLFRAIHLGGTGSSFVRHCFIGTDGTGDAEAPGTQGTGILVESPSNTIGGTSASQANVISANATGIILEVGSQGTAVQGNRIGTDLAGDSSLANGVGIEVRGAGATIGGAVTGAGNLISGNDEQGILITGQDCAVEGNIIGLRQDGVTRLGNGMDGIRIEDGSDAANATNNRIGGTTPAARNVISGNGGSGVLIQDETSTGNLIQGNIIGLDLTGVLAVGNDAHGVNIDAADGTDIGGLTPGAGNVISGNAAHGLVVTGRLNLVRGNLIGTDASGMAAVPNGLSGVQVSPMTADSGLNLIGGSLAGSRNIISGNLRFGVDLTTFVVAMGTSNVVAGNWIGLDAAGAGALGNGEGGIAIASNGDVIGGEDRAAGNVISGNGGPGIRAGISVGQIQQNIIGLNPTRTRVIGNAGAGIRGPANPQLLMLDNSCAGNAGLGIDLGGEGPTANDAPPDSDNVQNWPVLAAARLDENPHRFTGLLSSKVNTEFIIQYFVSQVPDPSGHGEGESPFLTFTVTSDAFGLAQWNVTSSAVVPSGRYITATATNSQGGTSEFSPQIVAVGRRPGVEEIVQALLGIIPSRADQNVNGDPVLNAADVVRRLTP